MPRSIRRTGKGRQRENSFSSQGFRELYKILADRKQVPLYLLGTGRKRVPWIDDVDNIVEKEIPRAIQAGASYLPFIYQEAYVAPLQKNLELVLKQELQNDNGGLIEALVGAIFDHVQADDYVIDGDAFNPEYEEDELNGRRSIRTQVQQFLAVISNFYRAFLGAKVRMDINMDIENSLPSLATFKYKARLDWPGPCAIPAEENKALFGASVGVVVLPSTYRNHPVLWGVLAHEVGGHDVLRAVKGLLRELEQGVYRLLATGERAQGGSISSTVLGLFRKASPNDRELIASLWRYWINEAAADILGVLNMGPAFAIGVAAYTAAQNKQTGLARGTNPRLFCSPFQRPGLRDVNTHPSDILRLWAMIGAIENLRDLDTDTKTKYVEQVKNSIDICTTELSGRRRADCKNISIYGYLQSGNDTWDMIADKRGSSKPRIFDLEVMQQCAREVGRYIVTEHFNALRCHSFQDLVTWNDSQNRISLDIQDCLLKHPQVIDCITQRGDDAQLLAGAILADFAQPSLYCQVNDRLAEALELSFDRDEIWGDSFLSVE